MKRVLLLGCGGSAGINWSRGLLMAPEPIHLVGIDINRYYIELSPAAKKFLAPHKNIQEYAEKINKVIAAEKIEFVHAQPDPEVKKLGDMRDMLHAKTFLPTQEGIRVSQDKMETYHAMTKKGVPVPKSIQLSGEKDLERAFREIHGTIWLRATRGAGGKASLPVTTPQQAKYWVEYWLTKGLKWSDFACSEMLPGAEVSWLSLWKDGELVTSQGKQRAEWVQAGTTPSGVTGTTAIQVTVSRDDVNKVCTDAVLAADPKPNGVYVVDVKENASGVPCVMEINPGRFFTTSLFFPTAGANFPHWFVKLAYGEKLGKVPQYNAVKPGIYWIRVPDGGPVMIADEKWTATTI